MKILLLVLAASIVMLACNTRTEQEINYPETRKVDTVDTYFGIEVADPYRWLEDDMSAETADWVKAQNEVTFNYLQQIPYREQIRQRIEELWSYEKRTEPVKHGDWYYFYKNDGLQNQDVLYRSKSIKGEAEIFIDPNTFSEEGTTALAGTEFTKEGEMVGLLIQESGSDWRKIVVLDTKTKEVVGDTIVDAKFTGLSWKGTEGFYYSSYDKPGQGSQLSAMTQHHKLMYHELRTNQSADQLIFGGEEQPYRYIYGYVTEDGNYLIIGAANSTSGNHLYVKDLKNDGQSIIPLITEIDNKDFSLIGNQGAEFYVETNYEAPNYKVVKMEIDNPEPEKWQTIIAETENVLSANIAGDYILAKYLVDAQSKAKQFDMDGNLVHEIQLPGIGNVSGLSGRKRDEEIFYEFTSFTYPATIFKYNLEKGESELFWQPEIDIDLDNYETKQLFFTSKDGTRVPIFVVHKKGLQLNGENPTYLYGYGGFNVSLNPSFNATRLAWLERGGIFAQVILRGGGEYGEEWHLAGTQMKKQNVFDDFIAAAEYLIDNRYTSSRKLAIAGGSNGGLLVGAVMTQRPDLMAVALPAVGVLDMLRYHKFTAGAGWAFDYGTVDQSEEMFQYLLDYSPLHNVEAGCYPATLVTTGDHDDRVVPAHSFKFAATLQEQQSCEKPAMIRIETAAGHGSGKPASKIIQEWADMYSFTWYNMGIKELDNQE
ncbi:MAG: prolyl oligopeptidase family serine peptidase [Cyclobacteriaceae bacterium]